MQSAAYAYTPYGDGKAGEILHTATGKHRFQIIHLAEFDVTGAYAEQVAKIINNMNGNFIKERFYAIPLENLPASIAITQSQGCRFIIRHAQAGRDNCVEQEVVKIKQAAANVKLKTPPNAMARS